MKKTEFELADDLVTHMLHNVSQNKEISYRIDNEFGPENVLALHRIMWSLENFVTLLEEEQK